MDKIVRRVAVGQMTATDCHATNFRIAEKLADLAVSSNARFLCLPECFSFIGQHWTETVAQAEPLHGARIAQYRDLAKAKKLWLSLGGFHEQTQQPIVTEEKTEALEARQDGSEASLKKVHNTHVVVDDAGEVRGVYRKIHLFDVNVPNGPVLLESRFTTPGSTDAENLVVVKDTPIGNVGLTTCYDLRFPELYTKLAQKGADVILVPSAFTRPTGTAHWHLLLRSRAVETQCFVVAAAQVGRHSAKRQSFGHALTVDPWGEVLADAGGYLNTDKVGDVLAISHRDLGEEQTEEEEEPIIDPCITLAQLEFDMMERRREHMPIRKHRRFEV